MGRLFGTDGVRGLANSELTPELAFKLGFAAGYILKRPEGRSSIIVGKDSRISGSMLESALMAGICSSGVDVLRTGIVPTPAIAYLARTLDTCAGAVISASHNPAPDNGIKFFNHQGYKLDDSIEDKIEEIVNCDITALKRPVGSKLGRIITLRDAEDRYIAFLQSTVRADFSGLRIVIDCANGAAYNIAPRLFRHFGAQVISLHDQPDGMNINQDCGSTHPKSLQEMVVRHNADLGLAFDGDADRVIAVDECGNIINGDQIMVVCALALHQQQALDNMIVVTVMSNLGLKLAFLASGITVYETKVGDRYVLEKMLETGAVLGGEQSGHIIFRKYATTGDGLLTALQLLQVVKETGRKLSDLAGQMCNLPQKLVNIKVHNKNCWEQNPKIAAVLLKGEKALQGRGRLFVRASGTEPLIRVMAEGPNEGELDKIIEEVAEIIRNELLEETAVEQQ